MKPILLTIKGLNSFLDEQVINFEELTSHGVFGIFGPTGSGKSTIIDAIVLALYGTIPRYDNKKVTGNFINTDTNEMFIKYKFSIYSDKKRKTYVIERAYKRSDKNVIKSTISRMYFLEDETNEKIIITDKTSAISKEIEKIIGLTYEDFTRSVVLPQGKFNEFLNLDNKARRDMLERIFRLEKFGDELTSKIKVSFDKEKSLLNNLQFKLKLFYDISRENINKFEDEKNLLIKELEQTHDIREAKILEFEKLKGIEEKINRFVELKNKEKLLLEKSHYIASIKEAILESNIAKNIIPVIDKIKKQNESHALILEEFSKTNELKKIFLKEEKLLSESYKKAFDEKEMNYKICLEKIEKGKQSEKIWVHKELLQKDIDKLYLEKNNKESQLENFNILIKDLKLKENQLENFLKKIEDEKKEINVFTKQRDLIQEGKKTLESKNMSEKALLNLGLELENTRTLYKEEKKSEKTKLNRKNKIIDFYKMKISNNLVEIKKSENTLKSLQKEYENDIISILRKSLHNGENCPVCNNIYEDKKIPEISLNQHLKENIKKDIENINNEMNFLISETQILKDKLLSFGKIVDSESNSFDDSFVLGKNDHLINIDLGKIEERLKNLEFTGANINEKIKLERENFHKFSLTLNDIEEKLKTDDVEKEWEKLKKFTNEKNELEKLENDKRKELSELIILRESKFKEFRDLENDFLKISETYKINKEFLEKEETQLFNLIGQETPSQYIEKIEKQINDILEKERDLKIKLENIQSQNQENQNKEIRIKEQLDFSSETKLNNELELKNLMEENHFANEDEVLRKFLQEDIVMKYEKEWKEYEENISEINFILKELSRTIENVNHEDIVLKKSLLESEINDLKNLYDNKNQRFAVVSEELSRIKSKFDEVMVLKNEESISEKRLSLITELSNLFRGNSFIDYIAKSGLEYVTFEGSKRLKEMTRGRYSLELDDTDFIIVDNFHGGIRRSPKTLSGGETFIVSLCLSLSLSSKVQLKNNALLETLFLDEGFGTLDEESLDTVMNSLQSLRENKISMGIISHVEEIKNRMPRKLIITPNDGSRGSTVKIQ